MTSGGTSWKSGEPPRREIYTDASIFTWQAIETRGSDAHHRSMKNPVFLDERRYLCELWTTTTTTQTHGRTETQGDLVTRRFFPLRSAMAILRLDALWRKSRPDF